MCNRALNWAFEQKLPPIEKLVLVAIANMLNSKTNLCWPSQETLATRCGICRQRVNKALAKLRDMGLVLVERCRHACRYSLPPLPPRDVAHDDSLLDMSPTTTSDVANGDTEPLLNPRKLDSEPNGSGAATAPPPPIDGVKALWDRGLAIVGSKNRALMAKMLKLYGKPVVLAAIVETERENPLDPVSYLFACCKQGRDYGTGENGYDILARAALDFDRRRSYRDYPEAAA